MALQAQRIRIAVNRALKRIGVDMRTNNTPHLLKPSKLQVEVALFDDDAETMSTDLDDLDSITLRIKAGNPRTGPTLMQKTVAAADLELALTLEQWEGLAPHHCHALFEFEEAETNLDLGGSADVTYYLVLSVVSISDAANKGAIANGEIIIEESGVDSAPPPDVESPAYLTAEESDARYLLAASNSSLYYVNGDPNGFLAAARPAKAYDALGNQWLKIGSGNDDTGWEQCVGTPGQPTATAAEFVTPGQPALQFVVADPNGLITATRPAECYNQLGQRWLKMTAGASNTGWELSAG